MCQDLHTLHKTIKRLLLSSARRRRRPLPLPDDQSAVVWRMQLRVGIGISQGSGDQGKHDGQSHEERELQVGSLLTDVSRCLQYRRARVREFN